MHRRRIVELPGMPLSPTAIYKFIGLNTGGHRDGADNVWTSSPHLAGLAVDRGQTGIAAAISDNPDEHSGTIARIVS
jgi:hypothetical protein